MVEQTKEINPELLFAGLIRVSTDTQDKKGESLRVQKDQIEHTAKSLGGKIVAWYGGQEHATEGFEKKEIDRLLADAEKGNTKWNALICSHADRWSRDNAKSHQGLAILTDYNKRFFVLMTEYELRNPEHRLFLEMSTVFGAFQARSQKLRSITCRISRAKRGCCACGKRPFGRTFDKESKQWGVDERKKAIIEDIAKRYLSGERLTELAEKYNMNHANLHKILTKRSGSMWVQTFKRNGEVEKVKTKIPRLLPEEIIRAIREKTRANKTYTHGQIKYPYLLSRMIFCKHCGYTMFGQTNHQKCRYYRHAHAKRLKACRQPKTWILADEIEDFVLRHLFECFGNPLAVQKAIEQATPNLKKIREGEKRLDFIATELKKIEQGRSKILHLIVEGSLTEDQSKKELERLSQREAKLSEEQDGLVDYLGNRPSPEMIKAVSQKVSQRFMRTNPKMVAKVRLANHEFEEMTQEEKRKLIEIVFSGKTPDGRRMGVYIEWNKEGWKFDIHGHLIDEKGLLPMSDSMKESYSRFFEECGGGGRQRELLSKSACPYKAKDPL